MFRFVLPTLCVLFVTASVYCSDYFVDPNGDDNKNGVDFYDFVSLGRSRLK